MFSMSMLYGPCLLNKAGDEVLCESKGSVLVGKVQETSGGLEQLPLWVE